MLWIVINVGTETEDFHEIPELTMNIANNGDGLGFEEYVGFGFDDVMEANDDIFDELEGNGFFLIEALFEVGDVDLSVGGQEMLDVDGLLFLHGEMKGWTLFIGRYPAMYICYVYMCIAKYNPNPITEWMITLIAKG
jgi:hypothetical protein